VKALQLVEIGAPVVLRDVPEPALGPNDVLIRVYAAGICHSDAHYRAGRSPAGPLPLTLGHEVAGVVERAGAEVKTPRPGDRVCVHYLMSCGGCPACVRGDEQFCATGAMIGHHRAGGWAEFIAVPAVNAVKVTAPLEPAVAALVEPLGCIIHSSDMVAKTRARRGADRRVLICGAGPAGLLFTQYLRNVLGYEGFLLVSDPNARKRELAKQLGADVAIDPVGADLVEVVHEQTGGKGVEYLIEASGSGEVFRSMPGLICKQATVLLYGHGHAGTDLSVLSSILFKEPVLVSSVGASGGFEKDGRPSVYTRALSLIEQGRIDIAPLITHRYTTLANVEQALSTDIHSNDYVKGVVVLAADFRG